MKTRYQHRRLEDQLGGDIYFVSQCHRGLRPNRFIEYSLTLSQTIFSLHFGTKNSLLGHEHGTLAVVFP